LVVGIEDADIEYFSELDMVSDLDSEFDLVNDLVARLVVARGEDDTVYIDVILGFVGVTKGVGDSVLYEAEGVILDVGNIRNIDGLTELVTV
jgi:hypothetical protein